MTIIGNVLLFFATIVFIALNNLIRKQPPKNDAAVGYFWSIILLSLIFLACMILIVLITGSKNGYSWISPRPLVRGVAVTGGLICAVLAMAISALFKYENGPVPSVLRILSGFAPLLIPLLLLIAHVVLMNKITSVPPFVYKVPLILAVCLGVIGTSAAAWGWIEEAHRNSMARMNDRIQREDANHRRILADIDSCDVEKNMVFILVFTDINQDEDVRTKAVAKVKTNPQWQEELVRRLQNGWAPQAFYFLASNEVDNISLFPEAIKAGVLMQAQLIRETIHGSSHPSHFYLEEFYSEIDRVIRTVDKFSKSGVDYKPAMKELRAALDEPSDFQKPPFICIPLLDKWIREH